MVLLFNRCVAALTGCICIFIILLYIQVLYECTNAISAPNLDLQFTYSDIAVSEKIISKKKTHLSPKVAALAFFDPTVTVDEKKI